MRARPSVLVATCVLVLAPTGCSLGGGGGGGETTSKPSPQASASGLIPSGDPVKPSATPATGTSVSGTGYSFNLPAGWNDITKNVRANEPKIDTAGRSATRDKSYTPNLNVLTSKSRITGEPTRAQLENLAGQTKREISSLVPSVTTLGLVDLAGSPAVHQQGAGAYGKTPLYLEQFSTIHAGSNYILTFTFPSSSTPEKRAAVVDPVLASFTFG